MDVENSATPDKRSPPSPGERLTNEECRTLAELLARFCYHDMDQFESWRIGDGFSDVYILIQRGFFPDTRRDHFITMWPPGEPDSARFWAD